ncbi:hypothetical protein AB0B04_19365 [Streptomyces xinghaiensis]|uniref:Uncharacterized protein n=2 Tax=Streptomyces TaxID=1883 RepID=A0A3R7EMR3_9ACTN|nr:MULTISPECIES: hypothetical protein [Streptomyces]KNE83342.1 hypothetical protein ADZ36_05845 [Streptomyces fradiae]OFA37015.1 hypothetical protein BEN35_29270 [Streptomyces fradiae]PQM20568.1 hypothetical protein Sfr7A_25575 [Streptomyces xinghaiensis]RKM92510.1 hypothetical protein SFRA_024230 [Streptomyces xinghaiensis]RNC70477.1 hypothetical protein DC095_025220 [Streptomyces xinghaiensis]
MTPGRGLSADQRTEVLYLLRAGRTTQEAAQAIGKTAQSLTATANHDAELRAALDGLPVAAQVAAHRCDFLTALARNGGNRAAAEHELGFAKGTSATWAARDPQYAAVEKAFLEWLAGFNPHTSLRLTDAMLDKAAALIEQGTPVLHAAKALGTTDRTLRTRAKGHPRLSRAMAGVKTGRPRGPQTRPISLSPEREQRLRHLWELGTPVDVMADGMDVSSSTVRRWAKERGFPPRGPGRQGSGRPGARTPQQEQTLREMWGTATNVEIARALGVNQATVPKWAAALGLPPLGRS